MAAGFTAMDLVGLAGSVLILLGYLGVSSGRMQGESAAFQAVNLAGALLLLWSLWYRPNPGAMLLEAVWAAIAAVALMRVWLRRR